MTKIVLADLHEKLALAGLPILSVRRMADDVDLVFFDGATDEQIKAANQIVADYDQAAVESSKESDGLTLDEINSAKTVADLKALMIRQYNLKG